MTELVKLFEPGKIGSMELKNRVIMAPLGTPRIATKPGGYVSKELLAFYGARARGGAGLIQMSISSLGKPWATGLAFAPGSLSLVDDEHIPSAQRFVQAMHDLGVKVSFQITHHGVVLAWVLDKLPPDKRPPLRVVAPSPVKFAQTGFVPHPLTISEIKDLVKSFGQAAKRGKAAGFDAVRIQGCHGYLIHQFLSPRTNKRQDEYGGSLENRCRFACEVTQQIREDVGPDFPIILRMNGADFLEGGVTIEDAVQHARIFADAGVDALDVSAGPFESHHWQFLTMYQPSGALIHLAAAIKKAVKIPVITVGKIDPLLAEKALQDGSADFVQWGRSLMTDPEMPNKAKAGKLEDIRPCIYCDACMRVRPGDPNTYCAVNPALGRELEYELEPAAKPKEVAVIGGGPAGMEAAGTLAERGHKVVLYEKSGKLGGQWNILSAYRKEQANLVSYLAKRVEKAGVKVRLNQEATQQTIEETHPDVVVVATGAEPVIPDDIPGITGKNVVLATDVLAGKAKVGQEVVVVGGHLVGLDAAIYLAEQGKSVSVVEKCNIAWDISHNQKLALLENLINYKVRTFPNSVLESVTDKGVHIVWDGGPPSVMGGPRYELLFLKADTVVLAVGSKSESILAEKLSGFMPEVYRIGDCVEPRDILAAIHEATAVARAI